MKPGKAGSILLPLAAVLGAKEMYDRVKERQNNIPAPLPNVDIVPIYEPETAMPERVGAITSFYDTRGLTFSPQEGGVEDFAKLAQSIRDSML